MESLFPRIAHDKRGAVMVVGVVMGALLVGALFHLASIGNAVMWRERAQDAAAFENAVWHARGMNLLASLNLIMQVVLSVLVLWRIALIIAGLFVVLATVLCVASLIVGGEACGLEEPAIQLADKMRRLDKPISETVMRILGAMRVAQFAVSEATPALAWGFSGSDTQGAYPALTSASTWSASVIPSLNTQAIQDVKRIRRKKRTRPSGTSSRRATRRPSVSTTTTSARRD
jgi:hypothetical protein